MSEQDTVRTYLSERGCATAVIEGGLAGLVEQWEALVASVEEGYSLGLDDYLNELDVRQLLADALSVASPVASKEESAPFSERWQRADEQFLLLTQPTEVCLWSNEVAEEEGW